MNENTRGALAVEERRRIPPPPLVVDLDGTLLRTDLFYETFALLLLTRPWLLVLLPLWLLRGKAHLKRELARRVDLDVASLPVNEPLVEFLRVEKAEGRTLALISASDQALVQKVAARFGTLFDVVQGSDGIVNLAGARKLEAIRTRYGALFTYAGDERRDIVIWEHCGSAILGGHGCRMRAKLPASVTVAAEFGVPPVTLRVWGRALRLQQWAKNTLIFVPLLLSGRLLDLALLVQVALGFLAFSLLASASYLVNDLVDLRADRLHRSKATRPLASGGLPLRAALLAIPVIGAAAAVILTILPAAFAATAAAYLFLTLAYSLALKRRPMADLLAIALLFTIRIVAGMTATGTAMAPWLLVFAMFFFFSLATVKRYSECQVMAAEGRGEVTGRGYVPQDAIPLLVLGVASGVCSILVFLLFMIDPASPVSTYHRPQMLWGVCLILVYWLGRTWLLAGRALVNDDVVVFALKDRTSLVLGLSCVVLGLLANL